MDYVFYAVIASVFVTCFLLMRNKKELLKIVINTVCEVLARRHIIQKKVELPPPPPPPVKPKKKDDEPYDYWQGSQPM